MFGNPTAGGDADLHGTCRLPREAEDAHTGSRKVRTGNPDLAIRDVPMPWEYRGFNLARQREERIRPLGAKGASLLTSEQLRQAPLQRAQR